MLQCCPRGCVRLLSLVNNFQSIPYPLDNMHQSHLEIARRSERPGDATPPNQGIGFVHSRLGTPEMYFHILFFYPLVYNQMDSTLVGSFERSLTRSCMRFYSQEWQRNSPSFVDFLRPLCYRLSIPLSLSKDIRLLHRLALIS